MEFRKAIPFIVLLAASGCGGGGGGGGGGSAPAESAAPPVEFNPGDAATTQISCPSAPVEKTAQVPEANKSFYEKLALTEDGQIEIYTTRSEFDSFCYLLDEQGNLITTDDDSGTDSNCRITRSLRAGTYFAQVRAFDNQATGSFDLGIGCLGPFQEQSGEETGGGTNGAPGELAFALEWTHSGSSRPAGPDIDIFVENPIGETLSTSNEGLGQGPDRFGGTINDDDRGGWEDDGTDDGGGPEIASWPDGAAPAGTYKFGVRYFEGDGNVQFTLRVLRNGKVANTYVGSLTQAGASAQIDTLVYP